MSDNCVFGLLSLIFSEVILSALIRSSSLLFDTSIDKFIDLSTLRQMKANTLEFLLFLSSIRIKIGIKLETKRPVNPPRLPRETELLCHLMGNHIIRVKLKPSRNASCALLGTLMIFTCIRGSVSLTRASCKGVLI